MPDLLEHLKRHIAATGPITVAEYMAEVLPHYYASRDPLGAAGDFTTAPEISQCFGEIIGAWLFVQWLNQNAPANAILAELGPGRGTLMADAIRGRFPVPDSGFHWPPVPHMVETSPVLRAKQAETLASSLVGRTPVFLDSIDHLPDGPLFCIANEFFDALPIRQFVRRGDGFREICIGASPAGLFRLEAPVDAKLVPRHRRAMSDGDVIERCPAAEGIVHALATRIARQGGALLIIDYGYATPDAGDSLQALRQHRPVDPLSTPGEADLTAHVDFTALSLVAQEAGAAVAGPVEQGHFLQANGITQRFERLISDNPGHATPLRIAHERLTAPAQMGQLFKALAILPPGVPRPDGF